jgi:cell division septum initiation protein DivIVA
MSEHPDLLSESTQEDPFEVQMRGYSRRQVDEFVARSRSHARDLEERLSRALDDVERLRLELSTARQAASADKPHDELSERMRQILKLADDEATAQKTRANEDIAKLRTDAGKAADATRAEAKTQSERMLAAAQEQAERALASARSEADKTRSTARADAERIAAESRKSAESSIATSKAQAKQMLDEATARASAIHDGAERRLDLLKNRHAEAMRRLTEIRDVVTDLVAHDDAKGTLEEEVEKAVAATLGTSVPASKPAGTAAAAAKPKPAAAASGAPAQRPAPGAAGTVTANGPSAGAQPAVAGAPSGVPAAGAHAAASQPGTAASPGTAEPSGSQAAAGATPQQRGRHAPGAGGQAGAADRSMPPTSMGTLGDAKRAAQVPDASPEDVRVIIP